MSNDVEHITQGGEYQDRVTTEGAEVVKMEWRLTDEDITNKEACGILSVLIPKYIRRINSKNSVFDENGDLERDYRKIAHDLYIDFSRIRRPAVRYKLRPNKYRFYVGQERANTVAIADYNEGMSEARDRSYQIKRERLDALLAKINLELNDDDVDWNRDLSDRTETAANKRARFGYE